MSFITIHGITQRHQQRARKAEYDRVACLIPIPGETTTRLMARAAPWTRAGDARLHGWRREAASISAAAAEHRHWLDEVRKLELDEALDRLAVEYGAPMRSDYSVSEDVLPFEEAWLAGNTTG